MEILDLMIQHIHVLFHSMCEKFMSVEYSNHAVVVFPPGFNEEFNVTEEVLFSTYCVLLVLVFVVYEYCASAVLDNKTTILKTNNDTINFLYF